MWAQLSPARALVKCPCPEVDGLRLPRTVDQADVPRADCIVHSAASHAASVRPAPCPSHTVAPPHSGSPLRRKWPAEFNYSADAPKGHLPLTNALRGTRLFEAIMEHEAYNKTAPTLGGSSGSSSNGASQPGWLSK